MFGLCYDSYKDVRNQRMSENKRLAIFFFVTMATLMFFDRFFYSQDDNSQSRYVPATVHRELEQKNDNDVSDDTQCHHIALMNESYDGEIITRGLSINSLCLKKYVASLNSQEYVRLFGSDLQTLSFGFEACENISTPTTKSVWNLCDVDQDSTSLMKAHINRDGIDYYADVSVDDGYVLSYKYRICNNSDKTVHLQAVSDLKRLKIDQDMDGLVHAGGVAYLNGKLHEIKYSDMCAIEKQKGFFGKSNGWCALTNKYWMSACMPKYSFSSDFFADANAVHMRTRSSEIALEPGQSTELVMHVFAGPKQIRMLDSYEKTLGVDHLDLAIDFGWFYFITKPLLYLLVLMSEYINNMGIVIVLMTLLIRGLMLPAQISSYRSTRKMKELQPKLQAINERYKHDKVRASQETMALYKKEGVKPLRGVFVTFLQIIPLLALYRVIGICISMRHASILWIKDIAAPDTTSIFNLFGLLPFECPSFLMIGVIPCLMGLATYIQQKVDPNMQMEPRMAWMMIALNVFMPVLFKLPAVLLIYLFIGNLVSLGQAIAYNILARRR